MLTVNQLRAFEAVARHRHFTRAAAELQIAQPSVTYQIRSIERAAGVRLVEVVGRKVFLTDAGERLAARATALLNDLAKLDEDLRDYHAGRAGRIRVGATRTIGGYALPAVLGRFRRSYPAIELRLTIDNTRAIERLLLDREVDCGVVEWTVSHPEIAVRALRRDPLLLIASPDHPLAERSRVAPEDLRGLPFIMREPGSGTRALAEAVLGTVPVAVALELAEPEAIVRSVEAGLGLAFISATIVAGQVRAGRVTPLPFDAPTDGGSVERDFSLATLRDRSPSPALAAFTEVLIDAWAAPDTG